MKWLPLNKWSIRSKNKSFRHRDYSSNRRRTLAILFNREKSIWSRFLYNWIWAILCTNDNIAELLSLSTWEGVSIPVDTTIFLRIKSGFIGTKKWVKVYIIDDNLWWSVCRSSVTLNNLRSNMFILGFANELVIKVYIRTFFDHPAGLELYKPKPLYNTQSKFLHWFMVEIYWDDLVVLNETWATKNVKEFNISFITIQTFV